MGDALGYSSDLTRAGALKKRSADEKAADDQRFANATAYATLLGQIEHKWEDIITLMRDPLFSADSPMVAGLKKLSDGLDVVVDKMKLLRAEDDRAAKVDKELPAPEGFWNKVNPWNERNIDREQRMRHPELQNQSFRSNDTGSNPLLQHVAFVNEEQKKGVDANTDQLKRLNDMLATAMGLNKAGVGGGGIINAAYTSSDGTGPGNSVASRGTTPRFGNKDFPNLGNDGAPNGSRVGAGSGAGAGAGDTPAAGPPSGNLAAQRAGFKKELEDDPALKRYAIDAMQHEGGIQSNMEQLFNMASMRHQTIRQALHSGQYGPVKRGLISGNISEKTRQAGEAALQKVYGGSNITDYATDQGTYGDPNFAKKRAP